MSRFVQNLAAAFRPPFVGLGVVVWAYFVWCFLVHPQTPILRGVFVDPDDAMVLTHVLDWLRGQSWFDTVQHRLNPPNGTPIHFSRMTELPLAALIWPLKQVGLDWIAASTVAAAIWPLVLLALLLRTLRALGRSFMPQDWAGVTAYVALFATTLMFQFSPGHIDHHGLAVLLVALAFCCTVRMMEEPSRAVWGAGAGFFLAFGLVVALETLPWFLMLAAWVVGWMMARGQKAALSGLAFGQVLYLASAVFLAATLAPEAWFRMNLLAYSVV